MKKNLFYLFALICSMGLLASCDDDDDVIDDGDNGTDYTEVIENELAGDYKGTLSISVDGQEVSSGNLQQVTVVGAGSNSITLSLSDFSFGTLEIGDVSIENCELVQSGSSYTFSGTTSLTVSVLTADVEATGTIGDGSLSIDMEIAAMLGTVEQAVAVTYSGTKLSGTEGSEADIVSFTFDEEVVFTQPVIDGDTITFEVLEGADITSLVPTIEVSTGATVTPASGVAQDFTNPVTYTVVSEDYSTTRTYTVYAVEVTVSAGSTSIYYDFEDWTPYQEGSSSSYYEPTGWCSSNMGAMYLMLFGFTNSYVVMETDDAYAGEKAALITTIDSKGMAYGSYMIPKVTTGSLYLGDINVDLENTLNSTKFGIPFTQVPVSLKGWYKYTPGDEYYSVTEEPYADHCHEAVLDSTMTDEFIISVVLYTFEDGDDYLTGATDNNIYTSDRVVAIAQLTGGEQTSWTNFELPLEWKQDYDASKNYYLAIICSSSKDGDKFSGAPGSTLIVDEFELVCE